jgi:hypothetical protein
MIRDILSSQESNRIKLVKKDTISFEVYCSFNAIFRISINPVY